MVAIMKLLRVAGRVSGVGRRRLRAEGSTFQPELILPFLQYMGSASLERGRKCLSKWGMKGDCKMGKGNKRKVARQLGDGHFVDDSSDNATPRVCPPRSRCPSVSAQPQSRFARPGPLFFEDISSYHFQHTVDVLGSIATTKDDTMFHLKPWVGNDEIRVRRELGISADLWLSACLSACLHLILLPSTFLFR
jgi:hypothetical protein